ncbi:putative porin [Microbulbifer sp.]|uniref:putative porin n=1 Tax=Microbulbifer sp. TaxID=1908541 RepID=UPI003F3E7337
MKFKFAALPLMIFAASAAAESYQSISEAKYINTETDTPFGSVDTDQVNIDTTYYFSPLETRGPLKEFDYIIKSSKVSAAYSYLDTEGGDTDALGVGGEYFAANGFVVGGSYIDSDGADLHTLSAGYLFTPSFLATVRRAKVEGGDAVYFADLRYNHELGGSDYIGFNFSTDDDFDSRTLSSKFFKDLGGETWFVADASYTSNDDFDNNWDIGAEYYFSKETSVGIGYNKAETFDLGVSHFFNRNIAGSLAYSTNNDLDVDQFLLGLTVQL